MEPDVTFVQEVKVQNAEIAVVKEVAIKPSLPTSTVTTATVVKLAEVATNAPVLSSSAEVTTNAPASSLSVEPMDKTAAKSTEVEAAAVKLMDESSAAFPTTNPMALKPALGSADIEFVNSLNQPALKLLDIDYSSDDDELETVKQEIMKSATDESNSEVEEGELTFLHLHEARELARKKLDLSRTPSPAKDKVLSLNPPNFIFFPSKQGFK